jgi:hypothetical protein
VANRIKFFVFFFKTLGVGAGVAHAAPVGFWIIGHGRLSSTHSPDAEIRKQVSGQEIGDRCSTPCHFKAEV